MRQDEPAQQLECTGLGGNTELKGKELEGMRRSFHVAVVSLRRLGGDSGARARSDPCCVVEVPGRPDCTFSTVIIEGMPGRSWNHEATFSDCSAADMLVFTVNDKELGTLGTATLSGAQFADLGFDGELPLSGPGKGVSVLLKVKVWMSLEDPLGEETTSTRSGTAGQEAEGQQAEPVMVCLTDLSVPMAPPVPFLPTRASPWHGCTSCYCD